MSFAKAKTLYDSVTEAPYRAYPAGDIRPVPKAGILATNVAQFENAFSFYRRFISSKDPREVMECIQYAKAMRDLIPAMVADAENNRLKMLKDLGVSHEVEPVQSWSDRKA